MVTTPELIDRLSTGLQPVQRLRPPLLRAGWFLLLAGVVVALLAVFLGVRPDLAPRLRQPIFAAAVTGSLLTGVLAAIAAFHLCLPDRSRLWLLLPTPAAMLWLATIGYGCLTDWVSITAHGIQFGSTLDCFATSLAITVPLAAVLFAMLRHAAHLHPTVVGMMGGLAVGGIVATAMPLLHEHDGTIMVLLSNLGGALLVVALGAALGHTKIGAAAPPPLEV